MLGIEIISEGGIKEVQELRRFALGKRQRVVDLELVQRRYWPEQKGGGRTEHRAICMPEE